MSNYKITPWSMEQAEKLGVVIRSSASKSHKIDVFDKSGKLLAQVGAPKYFDYGMYLLKGPKSYADERRRLYRIRHKENATKVGSPAYYALKILW